jgi:predicted transcriptional regulator
MVMLVGAGDYPAIHGILFEAMGTVPVKPERLAQLEDLARRRGKSTADALDDVLADYLEWERQDHQEAVQGIRQGYEDVKAGRSRPADQFLDDFARKHGLPR